jgi:rSAM/selenodomain-associated transferase 2
MVSIIIPTLNEAGTIGQLVRHLLQACGPRELEVIVADGGSADTTCLLAQEAGARVVPCPRAGRALQMNAGAQAAQGGILYFLHADTFPPQGFAWQLQEAITQGYGSGCYRLKFDIPHWFLKANAWFTRFDVDALRFGDQSLFVQREVFFKIGGFNERCLLLEDQEIIPRLKQVAPFRVLPGSVVTSARKYKQHGVYRLQACYYLVYTLNRLGLSQQRLVRLYRWLLHS